MKISFIGGGNMAAALIGGLLHKGWTTSDIQVVEPVPEARARLAASTGIHALPDLQAQILTCKVLVLAVKPQQMRAAVTGLAGRLDGVLVLSIAAGIRLVDLKRWLAGHELLVRAMPNTPSLIGAGMTGLCAEPAVSPPQRDWAQQVMDAVGESVWVEDEPLMDAVTAVSGSGPAYLFYFAEALEAAACKTGLPPKLARKLALGTLLGAAQLAVGSSDDPAELRRRVTSKGGTTEAALNSMERDDVKGAIVRAVNAAHLRGHELGEQLGQGD